MKRLIIIVVVGMAALVGAGVDIATAQDPWKECEDAKYKSMKNPRSGAASVAAGKRSAETNCIICHGASGRGDGPAAPALNPRPADWISSRVKSEADGMLLCKMSINRGAMPPWKHLPEQERWDLVNYIRSLDPTKRDSPASVPESTASAFASELLAYVNRGEGLGLFRACHAQEVSPKSWIVVLCVPLPGSVSQPQRGLMKSGVGVQALFVMRELEQRYRELAFRVYVSSEGKGSTGVSWGYAFRNARGPYYNEQRAYQ